MTPNNSVFNKIKVLLVEDVQADRIMIARAIHNAGFNCEMKFAENIDDALTLSFAHNFDCILLDYPKSSGDAHLHRRHLRYSFDCPVSF